jgi:hypothetical protein
MNGTTVFRLSTLTFLINILKLKCVLFESYQTIMGTPEFYFGERETLLTLINIERNSNIENPQQRK